MEIPTGVTRIPTISINAKPLRQIHYENVMEKYGRGDGLKKALARELHHRNKAANNARSIRWLHANPEKARECAERYRRAHPDRIREKDRRYRAANLEAVRKRDRERKAAIRWRRRHLYAIS